MSNEEDLFNAVAADTPQPTMDIKLVRRKAVELREQYLKLADLIQRANQVKSRITKIERDELLQMVNDAKVSGVDVDPVGNHPAFRVERSTVYTAKIPDDKREEAFEWFESQGHGDLIKSIINIVFGMQEHEERLRVMKILKAAGIQYYTNESIHHQTLRAFVKREIKANHILPRELLGVYVFDEVKILDNKILGDKDGQGKANKTPAYDDE